MDFSYTIFPVKKINVGKILKLLENRYLIILSIHILKLEISGCDTTTEASVRSVHHLAEATTLLTPNFGTGRSLICGPNLVKKSVRKKEGFPRKIRQRSSRSAIGFRSARKLFALILRDCVMTWPERKGRMDG
jgi:hypothetical protein